MCNTCGCKDAESFEAETWGVQIYDTDLTMADVKKMLKEAGIKTKGSVRKIGNGYGYYFKFDSSHQSKFEKAFKKFGKAGNYEYEAESFEAIEMFDQNKEDFIGEIDLEGFSPDNFEVAQDDLFRYIHDSKRDGRTKMAMVAIYLQGRDNLGKMMGAESFEAQEIDFQLLKDYVGNLNTKEYRDFCYEFDIDFEDLEELDSFLMSNTSNSKVLSQLGIESFEAQTKLTAFTRGKDWEGKPYTGQIFPDHPDLDPKLADRNKDGKMASWERAIGNQVAKGKSRFKAPRKMIKTTTKFTQRKPITAASSLLPYAIAVGALATILGLRGKE